MKKKERPPHSRNHPNEKQKTNESALPTAEQLGVMFPTQGMQFGVLPLRFFGFQFRSLIRPLKRGARKRSAKVTLINS